MVELNFNKTSNILYYIINYYKTIVIIVQLIPRTIFGV